MADANDNYEDDGFGAGDINPDEIGGGGEIDLKGKYHFECADVAEKWEDEKVKEIQFTLVCLQSVDGQSPAGGRFWHHMYPSTNEKAIEARVRFGLGVGVLAKKVVEGVPTVIDAATGGKPNMDTWKRMKGMQFLAPLKFDKGGTAANGKVYEPKLQVPFGEAYHVHDPAVAHWPRNVEAASMIPVPPEFVKEPAAGGTKAATEAKTTPPAKEFSPEDAEI